VTGLADVIQTAAALPSAAAQRNVLTVLVVIPRLLFWGRLAPLDRLMNSYVVSAFRRTVESITVA